MLDENFDILDSIEFPVFVLDVKPGGGYIFRKSNKANVEITGIPVEELEGKSPAEVFPNRVYRMLESNYDRAIRSRKKICYDVIIPLRSGELRLNTSLVPIHDANGDVCRLVGSSIDVTDDAERAERDVAQDIVAHELLKESEQFVSMAAHDLRTPMRNVKLLAEMLRDDFVDHGDGKMQLIESLIDVAQRSSALLSEVLSYTKTKQTQGTVCSVFPFQIMCQNIIAALDPSEAHDVQYPMVSLYADSVTLHIIIRNLLDNALKHGDRDHVQVQIEVDCIEDGFLCFSIHDNGIGLENPGSLFLQEGKFRADTGFGLLAIKQLILSRGGSISAENREHGAGATIYFKFPGEVQSPELPLSELNTISSS